MTRIHRAEALFASSLQPSDHPTAAEVAAAIWVSLAVHGGIRGCIAVMAAAYGKDPDLAALRMQWALALVADDPVAYPEAA